jgi:hypothetical protein
MLVPLRQVVCGAADIHWQALPEFNALSPAPEVS